MIITHHNRAIEFLGDPHLGKTFIHGVPLHRRGDREKMVWADFERSVSETSADFHINLGDLLDRPVVPYDVIVRAARIYAQAARHHPETQFLILQGNHDVSRDLERVSAFDVFAEIVWGLPNIRVVREPIVIDGLLLVPFDPVTPTAEVIAELEPSAEIAVGHWDVTDFGGDDHNLIPTRLLAELGVKRAFTGHVHKPNRFTKDGIDVVVVGSLQPFSYGEGPMYITLSLNEARQIGPAAIRDMCVRIQLQPGETYDLEIDCLQLTLQRLSSEDETVTLGDFDMAVLFNQAFEQAAVSADLRATVLAKHDELRVAGC